MMQKMLGAGCTEVHMHMMEKFVHGFMSLDFKVNNVTEFHMANFKVIEVLGRDLLGLQLVDNSKQK